MDQERVSEENSAKERNQTQPEQAPQRDPSAGEAGGALAHLQQQVGNRAVQRMLAQRSGDGAFDLDENTQARINRERGGGQPLDGAVQDKMGAAMGQDLSDVKVHTSRDAVELNHDLSAKAFTTGDDVFFSEGAYDPHSTAGQELIAHELTHVVQQRSGTVGGSSGMTVNAPGDAYEQEADATAKSVMNGSSAEGFSPAAEVQREVDEEELKKKPEEDEKVA